MHVCTCPSVHNGEWQVNWIAFEAPFPQFEKNLYRAEYSRRDVGFLGDVFPESSEWENIDVNVITNLRIGDKKEEEEEAGSHSGVMTRW